MSAQTTEHDLTPSEVALARVLAAWEAWPGDPTNAPMSRIIWGVGKVLIDADLWRGALTTKGLTLLVRARKAGVL